MHDQEERRRDQAERIIIEAWPHDFDDIFTAIWDEDAFGALAYKLDKARQAGADPVLILRGIDEDTLDWANPGRRQPRRVPRQPRTHPARTPPPPQPPAGKDLITMAAETTLTIIGNLTADPDLRHTPSGAAVANFTVASTPRTFDRQASSGGGVAKRSRA